ncbi:hypothetical protein VTK73DRAFT_1340 [Phialemonium thermophilum]|uniref:Uncharacterized protein n=1 Tax=Phialemonium thermophilum TaxID=223376 RepID=A0ABR3VTM5_9PEZI
MQKSLTFDNTHEHRSVQTTCLKEKTCRNRAVPLQEWFFQFAYTLQIREDPYRKGPQTREAPGPSKKLERSEKWFHFFGVGDRKPLLASVFPPWLDGSSPRAPDPLLRPCTRPFRDSLPHCAWLYSQTAVHVPRKGKMRKLAIGPCPSLDPDIHPSFFPLVIQ